MTPETKARQQIDQKLEQAGWVIQDMKQLNLGAVVGVAVREYPTDSLDIFWLKDDSLDNLDDLPPPDVLQQEIIEHLEAALASFRDVAVGLQHGPG